MQIPLLQLCIGCEKILFSKISLCKECLEKLRPFEIGSCQRCFDPRCIDPEQCSFPWKQPQLSGYEAKHAFFEWTHESATVWKNLKIHPNRNTLYQILEPMRVRLDWLKNSGSKGIIPIPPRRKRVLESGNVLSELFSEWISKNTKLPILRVQNFNETKITPKHRLKSKHDRHEMSQRFILQKTIPQGHYWVVDDFETTGSTLRAFAETLPQTVKVSALVLARNTFRDVGLVAPKLLDPNHSLQR